MQPFAFQIIFHFLVLKVEHKAHFIFFLTNQFDFLYLSRFLFLSFNKLWFFKLIDDPFLHWVSLSCFIADVFIIQIYFSYSSNFILFATFAAIQLFVEGSDYAIKDFLIIDLFSSIVTDFILSIFQFTTGNVMPLTVTH